MKITADDAGCWVDGSRGWQATGRLVEIALGYEGFLRGSSRRETVYARTEARHVLDAFMASEDTVKFRRRVRRHSYTVTVEDVQELVINQGGYADMAEDFLNTLAPEGYSFGWHDGDFFLASSEWWDEVSL